MEFSRKNYRPDYKKRNVREEKMAMRAVFKEKRKSLDPKVKSEKDALVCQRLSSLLSIRYADEILSFSPLTGEIDVTSFNETMLKSGKKFYLPRCIQGTSEMNFRLVSSMDELENGSFSIMEPSEDAPKWENKDGVNAVCIIPAMSYDKNGYRLGYGKGYYDRHLSSKNVMKIGICYTDFLSEEIPRGRFDLSVDIIVTEKGIINCKK